MRWIGAFVEAHLYLEASIHGRLDATSLTTSTKIFLLQYKLAVLQKEGWVSEWLAMVHAYLPNSQSPDRSASVTSWASEWVEFQTQGKQGSAKVCPANLRPTAVLVKPKPGLTDSLLYFKCVHHLRLETPEKTQSQGCENDVVYWEVEGAWKVEGNRETGKRRWMDNIGEGALLSHLPWWVTAT